MVIHNVVLRRHSEHVAVLPHAHTREYARERSRVGHQLIKLGGVLLDDDHRVAVDASGIVAHRNVLIGELDLHGGGRLLRIEHGAQQVIALVGEIRQRVLGARHHAAVAVHDQHVVDAQKILVFRHLGVGRLKARVMARHKGDAFGLGLVNRVERRLILRGLGIRLLEQSGQLLHLALDVGLGRFDGEVVLHGHKREPHDRHACQHDQRKEDALYFEPDRHDCILP